MRSRRLRPGESPNLDRRSEGYDELFGESGDVYHEHAPRVPHIDVHTYLPNRDRPFFTLVTGGMSDLPMPGAPAGRRRAELVLYVDTVRTAEAQLLSKVAHYPFDEKTRLGWGHTADFRWHPILDALFFYAPPVEADAALDERLVIGGEGVSLLWVVPLSKSELQVKLDGGVEALADLLDDHDYPVVFDPDRLPYV
jgi:hypothetical protein